MEQDSNCWAPSRVQIMFRMETKKQKDEMYRKADGCGAKLACDEIIWSSTIGIEELE